LSTLSTPATLDGDMISAAVSESWAEGKRRSGATLTPSPWDFGLEWRILACSSLDQNDHAGAVLMPPWCRPLPLRMAPNCERGRGTALQVRSGVSTVLLAPGQSEPAALPPRACPLALARWLAPGGDPRQFACLGAAGRPGPPLRGTRPRPRPPEPTLFPGLAR
jgi:hypothetical protein